MDRDKLSERLQVARRQRLGLFTHAFLEAVDDRDREWLTLDDAGFDAASHAELLAMMGSNPQPYLRLSYWTGRLAAGGLPVFFITGGGEPRFRGDPRFHTWRLAGDWRSLSHPAEGEAVLTTHLDRSRPAAVEVPVDVHWHIQFPG
jgi:hypothetical protein